MQLLAYLNYVEEDSPLTYLRASEFDPLKKLLKPENWMPMLCSDSGLHARCGPTYTGKSFAT